MKRHLMWSLIFYAALSGLLLFGVDSRASEISPNYVPLKMNFSYYGSPVCWGSLSADRRIYVFRPAYKPEMSENTLSVDGPELFTPTVEDWQAFYTICESADIWNLGKEGGILSEDIARTPLYPRSWSLNLEYPNKKLEIKGKERYMDIDIGRAMRLPGNASEEDGVYMIISDNIDIVMEYEKVQSVWDSFGKYIIRGKKFPLLRKY